uniref:Uncharacterized protein n=1 Tax=Strix occidentalis caurina TaxID=311401 RepID=A0A8D0FJW4_STROC
MPSGKETRLLHLSEMEKLDKTLFRLEQGSARLSDIQNASAGGSI